MKSELLSEGQVCPGGQSKDHDCHIDQRWEGFRGFACPHCACRLVVACRYCNRGAIGDDLNGLAVCEDHKGLVLHELSTAVSSIIYNDS